MNKAEFDEYLEKRYYDQLNYYEKASARNQKKYKNFQWILIIFSTLTTILAAFPPKDFETIHLNYIIVATSALVTILTAGLKTFQYQELWVSYRSTIEQLKPEIYYYKFKIGDYGTAGVDRESTFVYRVEQILSKEHDMWPVSNKSKESPGNQQTDLEEELNKLDSSVRTQLNTQKAEALPAAADTQPAVDSADPKANDNVQAGNNTSDLQSDKDNAVTGKDVAADATGNDKVDNADSPENGDAVVGDLPDSSTGTDTDKP